MTNLILVAMVFWSVMANAAEWQLNADIRERYQVFNNFDFNRAVDSNHQEFDSRLYLRAKADWGNGLKVFLQPQAVLIRDHTALNGTQTFSQADLLQAYLQYDVGHFAVRLGRQQLVYGDQRLLGHLGWKDVARTFDGIKGMYTSGAVNIDMFAVHPADIEAMTPTSANPHGQSLVTWEDRRLIGVYGTYTIAPKSGVDAYFINWHHNQHASVGQGRNMHTFGARLFGQWQGMDAVAEAVLQSGTWLNTAGTHMAQRASAYAVRAGYTFPAWNTRLGVEYDYSPGDDKSNPAVHKNFVFPFHTNHMHYGEMDFFSWANMQDIRLSLKTSPMKALMFMTDIHWLSLAEARGDWLNVVGTKPVFVGAPGYKETRAGTEFDLKLIYRPEAVQGLKLVALYGLFNPGAAVAERNGGIADTVRFGYVFGQYAF